MSIFLLATAGIDIRKHWCQIVSVLTNWGRSLPSQHDILWYRVVTGTPLSSEKRAIITNLKYTVPISGTLMTDQTNHTKYFVKNSSFILYGVL